HSAFVASDDRLSNFFIPIATDTGHHPLPFSFFFLFLLAFILTRFHQNMLTNLLARHLALMCMILAKRRLRAKCNHVIISFRRFLLLHWWFEDILSVFSSVGSSIIPVSSSISSIPISSSFTSISTLLSSVPTVPLALKVELPSLVRLSVGRMTGIKEG
ncbi:hypothetical protein PENTCL1PPCAC_20022, partial [Pristionchus entomophagus]